MATPSVASGLLVLDPPPHAIIATDSQYHCSIHPEDEKDLTSSLRRMTGTKSHHILGTIPGTKMVLRKLQFLPLSGNVEDRHKYISKEAESCSKFQHPCAGDRGQPGTLDCAQNSSRNTKELKSGIIMSCKAFGNSNMITISISLSVACACPWWSTFFLS